MDEAVIYQEFRAWLEDYQPNPDEDEWTDRDLQAAFKAGADLIAGKMLTYLRQLAGE